MTTATQHVNPEEIMAMLDGELAAAEARAIAEHIEACGECAAIAEQFRETAQKLAAWTVPDVPDALERRIKEKSAKRTAEHANRIPRPMRFPNARWQWAVGGGCMVTVLFLFALFHSEPRRTAYVASETRAESGGFASKASPAATMIASPNMTALQQVAPGLANPTAMTAAQSNASAPMIARTVSLIIVAPDVGQARPALDAILARYQGYAAELNINTPEGSARSFSASLRIPAPALSAALADLRKLGRVQTESQSGEEVTQQHADLVARLKNARETEQRLLGILEKRTGKVEEILQVEEQISNTRGDIERMEAEQKALEHRVDFATVQLQLAEEYKAQLNGPSTSIGTRMHNAIVTGLGNAGSSLLGILLFFEEYGPVLLVWIAVLGAPAWFLWRRYRNAQSRI